VQFLPSLKDLAFAGYYYTHNQLSPLADGGFLVLLGRDTARYTASGTRTETYTFSTTVEQSLAPEIAVEESFLTIPDGGSRSRGSANVDGPALTRTFVIRNSGLGSLTGLAISFTGANAEDFSASTLGSTSIVGGGSLSFIVSFAPKASGARHGDTADR